MPAGPDPYDAVLVVSFGGPERPEDVVLEIAAEPLTYRLVHHPRSRRPARDQRGRYLYMPLLYNA